jgi:hypothetical protein
LDNLIREYFEDKAWKERDKNYLVVSVKKNDDRKSGDELYC